MKNKKKIENTFFAKIVPEYKTPYLRDFGGIKVTGSTINMALRWKTCEKKVIFLNSVENQNYIQFYAKFIVDSNSEDRFCISYLKREIFTFF